MALLMIAGACSGDERTAPEPPVTDVAVFAGGCYWCMEPAFDHLEGVVSVRAGYGGEAGESREAVEIVYDPDVIRYEELLANFWRNIDPFDDGGQFCDRGREYRSAIFVRSDEQETLARRNREVLGNNLEKDMVTPVIRSSSFRPAIESEQDYYRKHPVRYRFYRINCGRDARLREIWGEP